MAAAPTSWRPLGRLLVARGLLNEDQLEDALQEQALTGRRLGEILVQHGYISQRALLLALAEQYEIESSAEPGFGTGLLAAIELRQGSGDNQQLDPDRHDCEDTRAALSLVADATAPDAAQNDATAVEGLPLAKMEEQWAKLAAAQEQLAEAEHKLASLSRTTWRRRRQVERLIERVRQRDRRIADLSQPESEPAATTPTTTSAPDASPVQGHLVLAQLARRYQLLERDGPPPPPAAVLELPEISQASFTVVGTGQAPLPNDPRPCVLAQPIHNPHQ